MKNYISLRQIEHIFYLIARGGGRNYPELYCFGKFNSSVCGKKGLAVVCPAAKGLYFLKSKLKLKLN
jgi:hypothetical protein